VTLQKLVLTALRGEMPQSGPESSSGREPLLPPGRGSVEDLDPQTSGVSEDGIGIWTELRTLAAICGPAVVQLCAQQAAIVSNQMFAGSLGKHSLAAASLGFTVRACALIMMTDDIGV
jgi:hypothetical protein